MTKRGWAVRKAAQRAVPLTEETCSRCGSRDRLQRHHPDYSKPTEVQILCQACHVKADQRDGYRSVKQMRPCALCGTAFMPTHSKKHTLCSPECRSEMGRRNARKRWGTGQASQPTPPV
jgi:predicted nucleic acid-binding Zn ribbon protein